MAGDGMFAPAPSPGARHPKPFALCACLCCLFSALRTQDMCRRVYFLGSACHMAMCRLNDLIMKELQDAEFTTLLA